MVEREILEHIAGWIRAADRVVVLTGAGISTESGIPDFRGPQGVWTKDPKAERLSTLSTYMSDPEVRVTAWQMRLRHPARRAQPGAGHRALVALERKGKLDTLVTQNIDGLHLAAGTSPEVLIEIHGSLREVVCMSCGERAPMEKALARVRAGETDPDCRSCGGILKSATISFGQNLVANCDFFLAVGTSLQVYPVAYLPQLALDAGARLVIVNEQPTPYDAAADAIVSDRIGAVLPAIGEMV